MVYPILLCASTGDPSPVSSCFELQKVGEELLAVGGEDRFGMELDPPERKGAVTESHDFAFGCLGGDFQAVGEGGALDQQ